MGEEDDKQHREEQEELRRKRKASKIAKSENQQEKDRKRKEYRQKILRNQGASGAGKADAIATGSAFQKLLEQRTQGFQIDFRFRNAPPRPPVGPCFVGKTLDAVLQDASRQYKALNAVEVNHRWKLHSEPDLGVPLAPSAMDLKYYSTPPDENQDLHPDDEALLNWKGSMGDTAAEALKLRQDQARAAARAALTGRVLPKVTTPANAKSQRPSKKAFSRVLDEQIPVFMKKTTYLSNDYSRKVHDFKSLAQTKNELAQDLQSKQDDMAKRLSTQSIEFSFDHPSALVHPTCKNLKPKSVYSILPNVNHWGKPYTHVTIDKPPSSKQYDMALVNQGLVAEIDKPQANARMTAQFFVPHDGNFQSLSTYDVDVIPLKDEDGPHLNFCLWVDPATLTATYLPISSRVQLSAGRPPRFKQLRAVGRRLVSAREQREWEERQAEVDRDMAEKHHLSFDKPEAVRASALAASQVSATTKDKDDDDGEDDFGDDDDDDSDDEQLFGGGTKTIVAEH